jgi:hypothetical protein
MECEYCHHKYKDKYTLKTHQEKAKFCLAIQQECKNNKEESLFECIYCKKKLSAKQKLTMHLERCREADKINIISKYEDKIKEYESLLKSKDDIISKLSQTIADQTKVISKTNKVTLNNCSITNKKAYKIDNLMMNVSQLTPETIINIRDKIDIDQIDKYGITECITNAIKEVLADKVICTDLARKRILYKNENNDTIVDENCNKLKSRLLPAIEPKITNLSNQLINRNEIDEVSGTSLNENHIDSFLIKLDKIEKLARTQKDLRQAAKNHVENKLTKRLTKEIVIIGDEGRENHIKNMMSKNMEKTITIFSENILPLTFHDLAKIYKDVIDKSDNGQFKIALYDDGIFKSLIYKDLENNLIVDPNGDKLTLKIANILLPTGKTEDLIFVNESDDEEIEDENPRYLKIREHLFAIAHQTSTKLLNTQD